MIQENPIVPPDPVCPLLAIVKPLSGPDRPPEDQDCYGPDCAWWDEDAGRCAVLLLAQSLRVLSGLAPTAEGLAMHLTRYR